MISYHFKSTKRYTSFNANIPEDRVNLIKDSIRNLSFLFDNPSYNLNSSEEAIALFLNFAIKDLTAVLHFMEVDSHFE